MQVKICGITREDEIEKLNDVKADFAGFVLFFEKSKRNNELDKAVFLKKKLKFSKTVAVTVSPTIKQVQSIEKAGFNVLQVHGVLCEEVKRKCSLPIWRAFNVNTMEKNRTELFEELEKITMDPDISGVVLDGNIPGTGKAFDWKVFSDFDLKDKLFILAGGLNPENVSDAINILHPDVVDVSSGVEYDEKERNGKDLKKIESFIKKAKTE